MLVAALGQVAVLCLQCQMQRLHCPPGVVEEWPGLGFPLMMARSLCAPLHLEAVHSMVTHHAVRSLRLVALTLWWSQHGVAGGGQQKTHAQYHTSHHAFFYVSLLLLLDATKAGFGQRKLCAKKASCMVGALKTTALGIGPLRCQVYFCTPGYQYTLATNTAVCDIRFKHLLQQRSFDSLNSALRGAVKCGMVRWCANMLHIIVCQEVRELPGEQVKKLERGRELWAIITY